MNEFSIAIFKWALSYLWVIQLSVGEIRHHHMQAPLAAAISPLVISSNTWMKWGLTTTPRTPCPTCGIPWHISVAFRKRAEQSELLTFCHIFKSCTQDSSTVLAVIANVIQERKSTMPRMDTVFKAEWQGLKRRFLAGYGIVTENGYFTDFKLIFERKNNPTFLTIP